MEETGKSIDEIKDHINQNKILMFGVPDFIKGIPNVYINCFDNTFFYFCKLLYNTNLTVFYKKIKNLKKNFNFFDCWCFIKNSISALMSSLKRKHTQMCDSM